MQKVWAILISLSLLYTTSAFSASIPLNGPDYVEVPFADDKPGPVSMTLDAVIGRPLLVLTTVMGAALFVVSLPFSIPTNNVKPAANAFMWQPIKATFARCLGCTLNMAAYDRKPYPVVS